jgi:phosphomevalonate kinase
MNVEWDSKAEPLQLPPGMILVLGDVKGGSKTPGKSHNHIMIDR